MCFEKYGLAVFSTGTPTGSIIQARKQMRKFAAVLFLLLCSASLIYGQKTRFGQVPLKAKRGVDYPIAIHIHGTHIRKNCQYDWGSEILGGPRYTCPEVVYLDAVLNGKNVELMGQYFQNLTISPGDYKVRLISKKASNTDQAAMGLKYELLFPEKYVWRCIVTGISD
jgi:hypothetical protein